MDKSVNKSKMLSTVKANEMMKESDGMMREGRREEAKKMMAKAKAMMKK